jgi:D-galacturonate reductase
MIYEYDDGREAAFDIHTSWVTPDNFPGYVEQEVQFRFDNGVWNGHSRKRGVECTVEGKTPLDDEDSINNHYNGTFLEPWGERSQRGYGIEVLERFVREVATSSSAGRRARTRRTRQRGDAEAGPPIRISRSCSGRFLSAGLRGNGRKRGRPERSR